jgi:haloalkane dehalogenase
VASVELKITDRFAYREALPEGAESGAPVLLVHGFPESSLMWERVMEELVAAGRRCVAPDLYCLGDSPDPGPATFERNREAVTQLHHELGLGRVALVVHDWGGFVGLAWACEHPGDVAALVISDTGFFADGRWHGVAEAIRGEHGEELVNALDRDGFAGLLRADGAEFEEATIDAYWRPFEAGRGRQATVEFYRSMDMEKLAPYDGRLGELGVPSLLLWGAEDKFAPMGGAKRFEREIPGAELVAIDGAGHFVFDQEPERCAAEVVSFLTQGRDGGNLEGG